LNIKHKSSAYFSIHPADFATLNIIFFIFFSHLQFRMQEAQKVYKLLSLTLICFH